MAYVDSFILPVATRDVAAYTKVSRKMARVYMDHGALEYREWLAEDVKPGKLTSFPQAVKLKPGETVVVAYVTFKSRAHRDKVNAKVMADPRMQALMPPGVIPVDGKRMIVGGFSSLIAM